MVQITQEVLNEITQRIVEVLHPLRIYEFGSWAYGTPHSDSDLDLMLVFPDNGCRRIDLVCAARQLLRALPFRVDVLVRFRSEFDSRAEWPTTIEATVKHKGRLLHG